MQTRRRNDVSAGVDKSTSGSLLEIVAVTGIRAHRTRAAAQIRVHIQINIDLEAHGHIDAATDLNCRRTDRRAPHGLHRPLLPRKATSAELRMSPIS